MVKITWQLELFPSFLLLDSVFTLNVTKIGPALWKIGSTDFVKMCEKGAFIGKLSQFSGLMLSFWCKNSHNFVNFCKIGPSSKTLEGTLLRL